MDAVFPPHVEEVYSEPTGGDASSRRQQPAMKKVEGYILSHADARTRRPQYRLKRPLPACRRRCEEALTIVFPLCAYADFFLADGRTRTMVYTLHGMCWLSCLNVGLPVCSW